MIERSRAINGPQSDEYWNLAHPRSEPGVPDPALTD